MANRLQQLHDAGVSVWLDFIERPMLHNGDLERRIREDALTGMTSNPTIFEKALAEGSAYDEQVRGAPRDLSPLDLFELVETTDVRDACDVLRPVHDATDGVDGRVSIEVDPRLARDTEATTRAAEVLWARVDRPNLFVKIPATVEGLPAITAALAQGISVNVTLIFSLQRYRAVLDAFLDGLEQARAAGLDLRTIASVASFFVSRVDTAVDARLDEIGTPEAAALRGTAAIANARLAWGVYEDVVASDRWASLAAAGARPQRPLWASTGVKDPAYPDTRYVDELVVAGSVNTMPESTFEAVADHGDVRGDTVTGTQDASAVLLDRIEALGVSIDAVTEQLEDEGLRKFETSWTELLDSVQQGLGAADGSRR